MVVVVVVVVTVEIAGSMYIAPAVAPACQAVCGTCPSFCLSVRRQPINHPSHWMDPIQIKSIHPVSSLFPLPDFVTPDPPKRPFSPYFLSSLTTQELLSSLGQSDSSTPFLRPKAVIRLPASFLSILVFPRLFNYSLTLKIPGLLLSGHTAHRFDCPFGAICFRCLCRERFIVSLRILALTLRIARLLSR